MISQRNSARGVCQTGYSLIELVAALLVAGILVGIGNGAYRLAVEDAKTTEALSDLGAIVIEIQKFRMRENGRLPMSLEQIGVDMDDPWGNPYRYVEFRALDRMLYTESDDIRIEHFEDFDLFSTGPDGRVDGPDGALGAGFAATPSGSRT
jgi:general secretion pathway protein G